MSNKHFKTDKLTFEEKKAILHDAYVKCDHWWADILDCSKSWARQKIDMSFEDIMVKFTKKAHFSIIHRTVIDNYLEIGFSTVNGKGPDYFLWIILDTKYIEEFTKNLDKV